MEGNVPKGRRGEELAKKYLSKKGYEILGGHFQKRTGEIDVVARDPRTDGLIFVEVKTASSGVVGKFGYPEERVTQKKLIKITKTIQWYLWKNKYPANQSWRIDVIGVIINDKTNTAKFSHYKNVGLER